MSRVLISGFYGFDNAGDEAVLAAMLQLFRERRPDLDLVVLSASPEATERLHGVQALPRMNRRVVADAISACDLFVSGGGSLLQDSTSARSAIYYLALIYMATRARKPVALYCQGIGPLRRPALRRLTRFVLNRTSLITVRDEESARELERLGVGRGGRPGDSSGAPSGSINGEVTTVSGPLPAVVVAADPVFALQSAPGFEAARWLPTRPAAGWLGVSVRPWPGIEAMIPRLAEALKIVHKRTGLQPLALPLQWDMDAPVCQSLVRTVPDAAMLTGPGLDPRGWIALIRELRALIAMRLHALIFAASQGVPLAGIAYDPKVTALLERLGERPAAMVPSLDPAQLADAVCGVLENSPAARHRRSAADEMAALAGMAADRTLSLLG